MDELKPCPFCSAAAVLKRNKVVCTNNGCGVEAWMLRAEDSIRVWNTRPREDAGVVDDAMVERALKALIQEEIEQFGYASTPYNGARIACMKTALVAALGKSNG
ncbi:hypothetical protein [Pseudoxanthomonas beigongshangi]